MALSGNLRTMDLSEILQWISGGRKTGTLHLERRSVQKHLAFQDGVIYTSWSNDPRESLGQILIRDRRVTEEQLFKALLRQEEKGQLLGAILVADGVLTEGQLRKSLQHKVEETVYDLFLWTEGRFEFKDGELPAQTLIQVNMGVTGVIMEGIRRVDEWARIRQVFPHMSTTLKVVEGKPPAQDPAEAQAVALAAAGKSLAAISLEMHRSEFEAAALLFDLHQRGLLAVASVGAESQGDVVGVIQDLLGRARTHLQERRYDAALEAYEAVLALDRLNQHAKKGLIAVMEARNRERSAKKVPLDRVPVLTMGLPALTRENFDPQEGFVLSRVNGEWDVRSILKLCPMGEEDALLIFARLLERKVIEMR